VNTISVSGFFTIQVTITVLSFQNETEKSTISNFS
jgi:hypothetical protein